MLLRNTLSRYGLITILLHWIMAALLIGLIVIGLYMVNLPISLQKLKWYGWHKEYGLLALALVIARLSWRLLNIVPDLPLPWWERLGAKLMHWALYLFMFAMPITGWLLTSASGLPASFFGLFVLPDLISPDENLRKLCQDIHEWLGYGLMAAILLHTAAALKHHFINKDAILRRMLS